MKDFACLKRIFAMALKKAGEETGALLGHPLAMDEADSLNIDRTAYLKGREDAVLVATVESRDGYPGKFHMVISARDAILLSGLLLGIPTARIVEKRTLSIFEPDDVDAFAEIMNQAVGAMKSAFSESFPGKINLKLIAPKKYIPDVDPLTEQEPIPDGDYYLLRSPLVVADQDAGDLELLFPLPLVELLGSQVGDSEEGGVEAKPEPGAPEADQSADGDDVEATKQTILILDDDAADRQQCREMLASTGVKLLDAPLGADLKELISTAAAQMVVVGIAATEENDLAICKRIKSFSQACPFSMIICARQWTRAAVLRALNCGARDIVMKPYLADELVAKASRLLKAA